MKATQQPHNMLVLEDLNKSGYKMANRFEKLDLDHALITLSKLAQFHASSFVDKEKITSGKQMSREPFSKEMLAQFHPLTLIKVKEVIKVIKTLNFAPEVVAECEKWVEMDSMVMYNLWHPNNLNFTTVIHGDCWMNNMLYSYNDKNDVEDIVFVSTPTLQLSTSGVN